MTTQAYLEGDALRIERDTMRPCAIRFVVSKQGEDLWESDWFNPLPGDAIEFGPLVIKLPGTVTNETLDDQ